MLESLKVNLNTLSSVFAIIALLVSFVWYLFSIDHRIQLVQYDLRDLEESQNKFNQIEISMLNSYKTSIESRMLSLEDRFYHEHQKKG